MKYNVVPESFDCICKIFGDDIVKHMCDHITFDPSMCNMKSLTNNNMTITSGFKDNRLHGALLNVGISEGIAEWEVNVDKTTCCDFGLGIFEKVDAPSWTANDKNAITFCRSGTIYVRGSKSIFSSYEDAWEPKSTSNGIVTLRLDMTKGELSMKMNDIDKGILADGLCGKIWWPYFFMHDHDCSGCENAGFTLKSFKYI
eukprot:TRINITY_DN1134_c1_g1_i2.p1 TRINITY_DN1134_c1_g1~~TRINITY_DN1134_c1_g1_i2.p1  ORF type:complete len:200 (-),score=33.72 TRINITY_DN1134_c1_g1_i2:45-644(-)